MYRIKPSKPVALFSAVFGVALIVFGVRTVGNDSHGFIVLWALAGAAIIVFNLWAAFSPNGSTGQIVQRETPDGASPPKT